MSYKPKDLIVLKDSDGDTLIVQDSYHNPGTEVFLETPHNGVFLTPKKVKKLRKALKKWLRENGHFKSKPWA